MKLLIFWLSYLWFPFTIACIWIAIRRTGMTRFMAIGALLLSLPFGWARFVEPRLLLVHHSEIDLSVNDANTLQIRIALFSDTHLGLFDNAVSMRRIVDRINREEVDAIFVAGDLTYWITPEAIPSALSPLKDANAPAFAVMGNHDVGFPGPLYGDALYGPIQRLGVTLVENRSFDVVLGDSRVIVAGTSDLWQRNYSFDFKANLPDGVPVLLLTHNPDMALTVPNDFDYDLMLAGHTHGGQIRLPIPGLTRKIIPTQHPFDTGLHLVPRTGQDQPAKVFVTPGTGMVGLPMRFRRPPRIDILTLTIPKAG